MWGSSTDQQIAEDWHHFMYAAHQSIQQRQKQKQEQRQMQKEYEEFKSYLMEGEILVGELIFPEASERIIRVIENFSDFSEFFDLLNDQTTFPVVMRFLCVPETALELAS